jgi:hypothetical protein
MTAARSALLSLLAAACAVATVLITPRPAAATVPFVTANAERAAAYANSRGEVSGVAVLDTTTGAYWHAGQDTRLFPTESVVKTMIATRLLVEGQMYGATADTAWKMITQSDDSSATALYGRVGGDGLIYWIEHHYGIWIGEPPSRSGWWGNTHVTAKGLVIFYDKVRHDPKVAPWLLNAMHHATRYGSDGTYQYFGIPSATSGWAVKQGWGTDDDCFCHTVFNSTGFVSGDRYAVALLTSGGSYGTHAMDTLTQMARDLMPFGHVEESWHLPVLSFTWSQRGSTVTFSGYAFDRDAPSTELAIDILHGGTLLHRIWTTLYRSDVNSANHLSGDHGFSITFAMPNAGYEFEVLAHNRWFGTRDTAAYRWIVVNGDPIGKLQWTPVSGSSVTLVGYGFDPDATSSSNDVQIRQDGAVVTTVLADVYRASVDSLYHISGNHGFRVTLPNGAGTHTWCAYGVNLGSSLAHQFAPYGCATVTVP